MKIIGLEVENVKRLLVVRLEPGKDGHMVVIGGDNAQGKTSLLDAIAMGLGGGEQIPAQPIRQGASKGSIILRTEEYVITRTFGKSGTQLVVTGADKAKITSPQKLLDTLTSRVSFDPLAFTRMKADDQAAELRRLVGIDFDALDKEHSAKYAERTGVNREVKTQQARVDGLNHYNDAPKSILMADEIQARLEAANKKNLENAKLQEDALSAIESLSAWEENVTAARNEVARAELALAEAVSGLDIAKEKSTEKRAAADAAQDVDTAPILEEMRQLDATNEKVRANETWKKESEALVKLTRTATALTDRLAAIEAEKEKMLSGAKYPIQGLSFTADGVVFNGVPFDQASAAEQLRVSVAMGFALQPKLKIALIRDGSLLDDKSLALVAEIAQEHDGQVWIERVGKGKECSVILEAGEVAEERTPTTN